MLNCAHCGTQNRDGSKFCGNCGARMTPTSGLVCPMCGTANKMESVFCQSCGARLAPLTVAPVETKPQPVAPPIKGLSLPARESPGELPAELEKIPEKPAPEKSEQPSWLDQLRASSTEPQPAEQELEEDVPDWLTTAQPAEPAASSAPSEPIADGEIPDWLQQIRPTQAVDQEPTTGLVDEVEAPDWLKTAEPDEPPVVAIVTQEQIEPAEPEIETTSEPVEPQPQVSEPGLIPATEAEMPSWLTALKSQSVETETDEALPAEQLMQSVESAESEAPVAQPAWATQTPTASSDDEDIPDWLRTVPATNEIGAEPSELLVGVELVPEIQPAQPGEVPDWLASLKPATQLTEDNSVETAGPLEGLRGVLPIALAVAEPHQTSQPASSVLNQDSARLFESILTTPGFEATPHAQAKRRAWTIRPLIYLLIALAVLVPFFIPSDFANTSVDISGMPGNFYSTLEVLPANSTVLISFDYDPGQSSEMDLQATAIVRDLAQRKIKIVTMSTLETGGLLAQRILGAATVNIKEYAAGANYVNLGYLPGHEAGLAQLATSGFSLTGQNIFQNPTLSTFPGFTGVKTLNDVALIIELAGTETALKNWMEQVQPHTKTKIIAGVSASVEPKARAYADPAAKQLTAMISGFNGAAQYEILSKQPGQALVSANAQSAAQLVFVFVILLGNLVMLLTRGRKQNVA